MNERELRLRKGWEFTSDFYDAIDAIMDCGQIEALAEGLSGLVELSGAIDNKTIYPPLRDFDTILSDIRSFLYSFNYWPAIKEILIARGSIRQVDLIAELALNKDMAGIFLWRLSELGVLNKTTAGRYNVLALSNGGITRESLVHSWPALFDKTRRFSMPTILANPPPPKELW